MLSFAVCLVSGFGQSEADVPDATTKQPFAQLLRLSESGRETDRFSLHAHFILIPASHYQALPDFAPQELAARIARQRLGHEPNVTRDLVPRHVFGTVSLQGFGISRHSSS